MDPTLQLIGEWIAYAGTALAVLRVAKMRVYEPSRKFVGRVGSTMDTVDLIDRRTLMTDARQSALIAAQPDAMFEADLEGKFTTANRAFEEISGYSRAHLTNMEWVNAIHPDDRFRVVQAWLHAVKDQRAWLDNCRLLTSAGRSLLVRIEAHPMRESIGDRSVVGWHGIICVEDRG